MIVERQGQLHVEFSVKARTEKWLWVSVPLEMYLLLVKMTNTLEALEAEVVKAIRSGEGGVSAVLVKTAVSKAKGVGV